MLPSTAISTTINRYDLQHEFQDDLDSGSHHGNARGMGPLRQEVRRRDDQRGYAIEREGLPAFTVFDWCFVWAFILVPRGPQRMRSSHRYQKINCDLVVSGGTGHNTPIMVLGEILRIVITPPGNTSFDVDMVDNEGDGIAGVQGNVGRVTIVVEQIAGTPVTITISGANGAYKCRLVISTGV